jgi:acetyl-CoA carboxylase biotin carboxyl carrier protein
VTVARDEVYEVKAMVPGMVTDVLVQLGDEVELDQELLLIESMKMETPLLAEQSGRVVEVLVEKGETVEAGQALMRLRAE